MPHSLPLARPTRPVVNISRVRAWPEVDLLGLLAVKGSRPVFKLPELPVEEGIAASIRFDLALDDPLLPGKLAALHFQLDEGDHDADNNDREPDPGAYVRPCARPARRIARKADRAADHEGEYHGKGRRPLLTARRYRLRRR